MKYTRPPAIDVEDATAVAGDVLSPKTFYAGANPDIKVGTITEATDLSAVDTDLISGNIKNGITIFGVTGDTDVRDVSDADAAVDEVKTGKTFYAVGGARKTGTMDTQSLSPANENVTAGYYAATTLSAVDGDLVTSNIKNGVTIFGVAGDADVRDISDADAVIANVALGKTFYAVGGARKTGTHECEAPGIELDVHESLNLIDDDAYSGTYARAAFSIASDVVLATDTQTFDTTSLAFAGAMCTGMSESSGDAKLRLVMGGVEVALSAEYDYGSGLSETRIVKGTRELDGSQTVYCSLHKVGDGDDFRVYTNSSNADNIPGGLIFGSMNPT